MPSIPFNEHRFSKLGWATRKWNCKLIFLLHVTCLYHSSRNWFYNFETRCYCTMPPFPEGCTEWFRCLLFAFDCLPSLFLRFPRRMLRFSIVFPLFVLLLLCYPSIVVLFALSFFIDCSPTMEAAEITIWMTFDRRGARGLQGGQGHWAVGGGMVAGD